MIIYYFIVAVSGLISTDYDSFWDSFCSKNVCVIKKWNFTFYQKYQL